MLSAGFSACIIWAGTAGVGWSAYENDYALREYEIVLEAPTATAIFSCEEISRRSFNGIYLLTFVLMKELYSSLRQSLQRSCAARRVPS